MPEAGRSISRMASGLMVPSGWSQSSVQSRSGWFVSRCPFDRRALALRVVVHPGGRASRQARHGDLGLRIQVDKGLEVLGEPRKGDLVVTACLELFDPSVG